MRHLTESHQTINTNVCIDALLLQAAGVTQLGKPRDYDVRFLQEWLKGSQEGAAFLRGRELKRAWDDVNMKDFVSLVNDDADSTFGWLNPTLVDWYNNLWGGRKEVGLTGESWSPMLKRKTAPEVDRLRERPCLGLQRLQLASQGSEVSDEILGHDNHVTCTSLGHTVA